MRREQMSGAYRVVMAAATPIVRWWGRLEVIGEDVLPDGSLLVVANHDSYWDPVVIGVAAIHRRQIRALAKASLWKNPIVGRVLVGMRQIPVERGRGDLRALDAAISALRAGACVGVFPEGTTSHGMPARVHSGGGRIAQVVPDTKIVCVALTGAVDIARFPRRPRIRVEFFEPGAGQRAEGESAMSLMKRLTAEVRARAPYVASGRRKRQARYLAEAAAQQKSTAVSAQRGAAKQSSADVAADTATVEVPPRATMHQGSAGANPPEN